MLSRVAYRPVCHPHLFLYTQDHMNTRLYELLKDMPRPGSALDLGAGDGADVRMLELMGWHCVGIDKKTGTNLNERYLSPDAPFDVVYSNFVMHKLKRPAVLLETAFANLRPGGTVFIQTFDESDPISSSTLTPAILERMALETGFTEVKTDVFDLYDIEPGHGHTHRILEIVAVKR